MKQFNVCRNILKKILLLIRDLKEVKSVFVQVIDKPARKVIIKRGKEAKDYCIYIMFQGEPFEEENFGEAIEQVWTAIKKYDSQLIGYNWDTENPRIQLEPIGTRGYIELHPVK